jgi:hypothetical protein
MATHRGIEATCQAVVELLRDNYDPAAFNRDLDFQVLSTGGFAGGLGAGVSVFLYRIMVNDAHRTPPGRRTETGELTQTQLPLDLHVILTAWGPEASLQQAIAGWMMRTLEDNRILPPGLLNRPFPDVFRDDESVELLTGDMVTEDLLHLWELLGTGHYQLSVPYVARNVRIESHREFTTGALVQERTIDYAVPVGS